MSEVDHNHGTAAARRAAELDLDDTAAGLLRSRLPAVAEETVRAIVAEVPGYTNALAGPLGAKIQGAVQLALGGFLSLASRPLAGDPATPLAPALDGAYALGRGEARSGRSMFALLAAYRVGARVAWRGLSTTAVEAGLTPQTLSKFAELVFAYIDELSAASVAGHTDELATTGRVRERYLQQLGHGLLRGDPADQLAALADRANWEPPSTLTAVVLPSSHVRAVLGLLDQRSLRPQEELPDLPDDDREADLAVLLVPDADGPARTALLRLLRRHDAYVGPARPWTSVRASYLRVLHARRLRLPTPGDAPVDTEQHLASLVVGSDQEALSDLRRQVLAPFNDLRPATAERLVETLREWLLHQGRRDDVATALHVHPQTVRYRMGHVRALLGEQLNDPNVVLALTVALANDPLPARPAQATDPPPHRRP